jgi:signal transduction histidine kinase
VGIAEPEQALIFQRFYQGEARQKSGEGSGLGLAIVEAIAHAHGGKVTLQSAVGKGATFTLVLPLSSHN